MSMFMTIFCRSPDPITLILQSFYKENALEMVLDIMMMIIIMRRRRRRKKDTLFNEGETVSYNLSALRPSKIK